MAKKKNEEKKVDLTSLLSKAEKKQTKTKRKPTHPVIEDHVKSVDRLLAIKTEIKNLNNEKKLLDDVISTEAIKYRIENEYCGTVEFLGSEPGQTVQSQEVSKYTDKIVVGSEEETVVEQFLGEKLFERWFGTIKRRISLDESILEDEAKLTELIQYIDEHFGLDILKVTQYRYPVTDQKEDLLLNERYKQGWDYEKQVQLDELVKAQRKIA